MASGRPDFHPTMLLEGKHDTQLIPVLVDENGQMYIVMTGQQIQINNLPSDYFKAGQAIGESPVGVTNLPSDYYKAGQAVGSVTANVNVAQTEKDRDMIGLDTATRRQIAVDAAGIILARLKGAYGATLKDIAVDDVGILLSRLKGAYGGVLKDVAVDDTGILLARLKGNYAGTLKDVILDPDGKMIATIQAYDGTTVRGVVIDPNGYMIARMKGYDGAALRDVKVDPGGYLQANILGTAGLVIAQDDSGYLLAKMTGLDGATLRTVAVDAAGNIVSRMKGYDGANLQDVKVDSAGYMLAKMTGIEGANLRTVAVDASGVMKANLTTQDLAYLKVRPTYGQIRRLFVGAQNVATTEEITIHDVTGKGAIAGGYVYSYYGGVQDNVEIRIYTDGVLAYQESFKTVYDRYPKGGLSPLLSCTLYQRDDGWFIGNLQPGTTFETSLQIKVYNPYAFTIQIISVLYYALVP